ncbi:MAG: hypothetical protein EBS82_00280 [Methylocystaceae bacterium]|nr:hypothetical protein [Methylocystaceae bacterium]NBT96263.1 hypothetical protein [Methylocystaceae bacterium]
MANKYKSSKNAQDREILLRYRYDKPAKTRHAAQSLPGIYQTQELKTEHDFINLWTRFADFPFEAEPSEQAINCWIGHKEQFGRLMLQLFRLLHTKKTWDGAELALRYALTPFREILVEDLIHPEISADHDWYRAWFSIIGHPDFQRLETRNIASKVNYMKKKLLLAVAIQDLTRQLESDLASTTDQSIAKKMKKIAKKIHKRVR